MAGASQLSELITIVYVHVVKVTGFELGTRKVARFLFLYFNVERPKQGSYLILC